MRTIDDLVDILIRLDQEIPSIVMDKVMRQEPRLVELITEEQLFKKGVKGDGQRVSPPYSPEYKLYKARRGQPTNRVTLRKEGDYHKSIYLVRTGEDEAETRSEDFKDEFLQGRYGEQILGLTEDSKETISDLILPEILREIEKRIL